MTQIRQIFKGTCSHFALWDILSRVRDLNKWFKSQESLYRLMSHDSSSLLTQPLAATTSQLTAKTRPDNMSLLCERYSTRTNIYQVTGCIQPAEKTATLLSWFSSTPHFPPCCESVAHSNTAVTHTMNSPAAAHCHSLPWAESAALLQSSLSECIKMNGSLYTLCLYAGMLNQKKKKRTPAVYSEYGDFLHTLGVWLSDSMTQNH